MNPRPHSSRNVTRTRIAIIVFVTAALAAALWWSRRPIIDESHRSVRQLILHFTIARTDDPIIVLGFRSRPHAALAGRRTVDARVDAGPSDIAARGGLTRC